MNKTRLLLASLLKPINDSRSYEKLGISLSKLPELEVHICGFKAAIPPDKSNITFHPLFHFKRLSFGRLVAQIKYLKILFKLKPEILIVSTHELLLSSLVYKAFCSCYLIYDIQENYYLNLTTQKVYPAFISQLAAIFIRSLEILSAPFIQFFFLAEESYRQEITFIRNRYLVLQNKFKPTPAYTQPPTNDGIRLPSTGKIQLLYSGTISELYGIYEAIQFCEALHQIDSRFTLLIIGYWPQVAVGEKVKTLINDIPYITLVGGDNLAPHTDIVQAITTSQVGLLPYHPHPSLMHCVPTKLFEYLAHALPVIVQHNAYWKSILNKFAAGFQIDFKNLNAEETLEALSKTTYYEGVELTDIFWETEEDKLICFLQQTILNR